MRGPAILIAFLLELALHGQVTWEKGMLDHIAATESRGHRCLEKGRDANPGRSFDITYHRLELVVDPAIRALNGVVTHHFIALNDLDELLLDLSDTLVVTSVVHQSSAVPFTHLNDSLVIQFPASITQGVLDSVSITYGGVPPLTGFGSFAQEFHEDVPVIWTLSEPYGAMDWWPCKQDLQDKADSVDILVTTPNGFRVASNGLLIEEVDLQDGFSRAQWRHRYPISYYLVAFAVTNYDVAYTQIDVPGATIPMETWAYPENAAAMQLMAGDIQTQLPLFVELFGMYPFANEKYGHAQFSWGGGMEHQTMSFMGGVSFELAAHELAHQWFGNKVTCGSWEDIWLNEGFASYLSGLCYDFLGPEYWHGWKAAQIADIVSQPDGSVFVPDTMDIGRLFSPRLSYRKGAFVLHMLRWIMGDDDFFQACRNYLDDPELAYSSARTSDLQFHFEDVSGIDLDWFFDDWFHGEGHPMYQVQWEQSLNGTVSITLDQQPSHPSVDFFQLPVPIGFRNDDQDTVVVLEHTFSGETFSFDLPFMATEAEFDPDLWLISGQNIVLNVPLHGLMSDAFVLYPNPVDDILNIRFGTHEDKPMNARVLDASGRSVIELSVSPNEGTSTVPVHSLAPGVYVLELLLNDRPVRHSFIRR